MRENNETVHNGHLPFGFSSFAIARHHFSSFRTWWFFVAAFYSVWRRLRGRRCRSWLGFGLLLKRWCAHRLHRSSAMATAETDACAYAHEHKKRSPHLWRFCANQQIICGLTTTSAPHLMYSPVFCSLLFVFILDFHFLSVLFIIIYC